MKQLAEFIKNGKNFAVISHVSPDGDTMGSAAALLYALEKLGKKGQWFCEGKIPEDYLKIPEIKSLVEYDKIKKFDSVIAVDISSEDRMGSCLELFKRIERKAQIRKNGEAQTMLHHFLSLFPGLLQAGQGKMCLFRRNQFL